MDHFTTTLREVVTIAQEVVKAMLEKGYVLGKDALYKAKALDESYGVSAMAASKVADMSRRIGLTLNLTKARGREKIMEGLENSPPAKSLDFWRKKITRLEGKKIASS
ncbi:hypothetical protein KSP39_PZI019832 [Platanthera zijinensis]|uniref:Uncharacterized protein n=1 Tax=Platanthera zijinensis TaxID=2320716 RepID=A0AAP0B2J0_9ASPA